MKKRTIFTIFGGLLLIIGMGFYFKWPIVMQGWPFLLFLLCPLMHVFMGHNHGSNHDNASSKSEHSKDQNKSCH